MKVETADSFWDSLKTLSKHNTWWYKTYRTIRYDIPRFIKNIYLFREALWNYRWWDFAFILQFMETGLKDMAPKLEKYGHEVDISRMKKVDKMIRARYILNNIIEDNYISMAEEELGEIIHHDWEFEDIPDKPGYSILVDKDTPSEKKHNKKVFKRSGELEEQEWNELFEILKGQDHKQYSKFIKTFTPEEQKQEDIWNKWYDGSGIRNWWD
jgi:hypothetical protein